MARRPAVLTGRRLRRRAMLGVAIGVIVSVIGSLAIVLDVGMLLSLRVNDRWYPTGDVDSRVAIVELPPEAAGAWSRSDHARVIDAVAAAGAKAIGYDVVFDLPEVGDAILAAAIAAADNVVLATVGQLTLLEGQVPVTGEVLEPLEQLRDVAAGVGNVDVLTAGFETVVRDVPLVVERPDRRWIPAMAYAAVLVAEGSARSAGGIQVMPGEGVGSGRHSVDLADGAEALARSFIPTDKNTFLDISWAIADGSPPPGTVFDVGQVLRGEVDLSGRVVFVGVDDPLDDFSEVRGGLDRIVTPLNAQGMPGVYVHANAANTILTRQYRSLDQTWTFVSLLLGVALVTGLGMVLRVASAPLVLGAVAGGWWLSSDVHFRAGRDLNLVVPLGAYFLAAAATVGARYFTEERERRRVAGLFRQYVPDAVADDLLLSEQLAAAAEGARVEVTVLFCDLRGFTATAATLEPSDVRAMLEVYYDHSTRVIQAHGGTVMQFVGDEVFAVFGAPVPLPDHAQRALDAAVGMQAAAGAINEALAPRGVSVAYGIGLNSGQVVAAHVGSQVHKQYAVVGQTVNVGARLCSKAEPGGIVMSKWTHAAVDQRVEVESLGTVELKGVTDDPEPVRVIPPS